MVGAIGLVQHVPFSKSSSCTTSSYSKHPMDQTSLANVTLVLAASLPRMQNTSGLLIASVPRVRDSRNERSLAFFLVGDGAGDVAVGAPETNDKHDCSGIGSGSASIDSPKSPKHTQPIREMASASCSCFSPWRSKRWLKSEALARRNRFALCTEQITTTAHVRDDVRDT